MCVISYFKFVLFLSVCLVIVQCFKVRGKSLGKRANAFTHSSSRYTSSGSSHIASTRVVHLGHHPYHLESRSHVISPNEDYPILEYNPYYYRGKYGGYYRKEHLGQRYIFHGQYQSPIANYYSFSPMQNQSALDVYLQHGVSKITRLNEYKNKHYFPFTFYNNGSAAIPFYTIMSNNIIDCHPNSTFICPENTETVCLTNKDIYCVSDLSSIKRCKENESDVKKNGSDVKKNGSDIKENESDIEENERGINERDINEGDLTENDTTTSYTTESATEETTSTSIENEVEIIQTTMIPDSSTNTGDETTTMESTTTENPLLDIISKNPNTFCVTSHIPCIAEDEENCMNNVKQIELPCITFTQFEDDNVMGGMTIVPVSGTFVLMPIKPIEERTYCVPIFVKLLDILQINKS